MKFSVLTYVKGAGAALGKKNLILLALGVVAIFWICTFKIMDRDFWWHITAGEIIFRSRHILRVDPFAYTREGLPYLASYEWLSQIFLYGIYHIGGSTAIILFRGVVASSCIGILLMLTKKLRFAYIVLGVWAIVITKGSFLERPQLFTFILFSIFVLLGFRFLDAETRRQRLQIGSAFVALTYLWVNLHGGAALLGCGIVTYVLLQTFVRTFSLAEPLASIRHIRFLVGILVLMTLSFLLPPNGLSALHYVTELHTDETISFIAEFQPRSWGLYLRELWPFFTLSIIALSLGRKHVIFNVLLLSSMAYLSRQAFRHEIFFVFAAVATCFYQCDRSVIFDRMWAWIGSRRKISFIASLVLVLLLGRIAYLRSFGFERQDNLFGFGQFDLARGAFDFLERENIQGNMFNTYGIGGYLMHRGYPDRKIFIDGRNVDYGFDFMARTYAAGIDRDRWDDIVHLYGITYAVIDYDAIRQKDRLPYSVILDAHPDWALVYVDDWTAIYLKRIQENQDTIHRFGYTHITASDIQFRDSFAHLAPPQIPEAILELRRMESENPEGVKAAMALAKIAFRENRNDDAKVLAQKVISIRPYAPEPYAILASIYARDKNWSDAAKMYRYVIDFAGDNYPDMNYDFIADVFEKAGHPWEAWFIRPKFQRNDKKLSDAEVHISATGASLIANPAIDALLFHEQALAAVEQGNSEKAEELFRTAIQLNPGSSEFWNNLCALLLEQKRVKEAIDACKSAISKDEKYADAHFNLALAYYYDHSFKLSKAEAELARSLGRVKESDHLLLLIRTKELQ